MTVKIIVDKKVNRLILLQISEFSMYRDKQNIFLEAEEYKKGIHMFS